MASIAYQTALQAQSTAQNTKDMFLKPLTSGAVAAAGTALLFSDLAGTKFKIGGLQIPVPIVLGGAVAVGSIVSELLRQYAFSSFKQGEALSLAIGGGINAGAAVGTIAVLDKIALGQIGMVRLGGLGVASEVIGDQLYHRVLKSLF